MRKLLSANFRRVWKDNFFWIGTIFMFIMGILMPIIRYVDMKQTGDINYLDNGFFAYVLFIAIVSPIFCSLFIGTEYSDGTIRNKLIIGHTRASIYFSNLIVCIIAGIIMCFAFIVPNFCIGISLLGGFKENIMIIIGMIICSFILTIALTSIFTLVSMLTNNKTITAAICILGAFFLLVSGIHIDSRLSESETRTEYSISNGSKELADQQMPNPNFLRGTERRIYEFLHDFTPGGQIFQLASTSAVHLWRLALYSTTIIAIVTGIGVFFFRKKDLK